MASKARFHVSVGHATVMATAVFFGRPDAAPATPGDALLAAMRRMEALSSPAAAASAKAAEEEGGAAAPGWEGAAGAPPRL